MFSWKILDYEQKLAMVQSVERRIDNGEDANYVTRPPKYIETGAWKRISCKPQGKESREEKIRRELMEN